MKLFTSKLFIEARSQLGIGQEKMAEKLGVNQSTICRIEQGEIHPQKSLLKKLCALTNKDINELLKEMRQLYENMPEERRDIDIL